MNQRQRDYAITRINESANAKIATVKDKFITPGRKISFGEKVDLIRKGSVKLCKDVSQNYIHLVDAFDFSKYESEKKFDEEKALPFITAITQISVRAKDKIMLAGDEEALKAIADFEEKIGKL